MMWGYKPMAAMLMMAYDAEGTKSKWQAQNSVLQKYQDGSQMIGIILCPQYGSFTFCNSLIKRQMIDIK